MTEVTHHGVSNGSTDGEINASTNGAMDGDANGTTSGTLNGTSVHRRIWICTHGRTASNLLMTLFAKHPQLAITDYNFHNAFMFGPERLMSQVDNVPSVIPPERLKACENATFQRGLDQVQAFIAKAEAEVSMDASKA